MNAHRPLTAEPVRVRLNVEQFEMLDRSGSFRNNAKTELLDGTIYAVNAQYRVHARLKGQLFRALGDALAAAGFDLEVLSEVSVAMPPHGMPKPDLVVTSEPRGDGPVPLASVALLVEVADTSLDHDLGSKSAIYAANGVSEYWVFDVEGGVIHQLWLPSNGSYTQRRQMGMGDRIKAMTLEGLAVETEGLA